MSHSQHSQLPSRLPVAARLLHTVQLYWKASPYYTTVQTSIQLHTIQLYKNTRYNSRRYKPAYNTTVLESARQHLNTTRRYKTALYKKDAGHLQHSQLMLKLDQTKIVSKYDKFIRHYKYCARQGIIDRRKGVNLY